jgi:hypothetical protein
MSTVRQSPARIAAPAYATCATNDEPPIAVESIQSGFRFRWWHIDSAPIGPTPEVA